MTPDVDIVDYLASNVTGQTLVPSTNIYNCPVLPVDGDVPEVAVFVWPFGGGEPERFHSCTESRYESYLTIWIRGKKVTAIDAYADTRDLAREIIQLLNFDGEPGIVGYLDIGVTESEPFVQGLDDEGRVQMSITAIAEWFE